MGMINKNFWRDKRVLLTGCTGFKGSWLTIWLNMLGAKVYGYSLPAPTKPSMWVDMQLESLCHDTNYADIRDYEALKKFVIDCGAEIIIHMAAQPLVRYSYINPRETYEVNVMGVVNLLDIVREVTSVKSVINVTTDKCYENKEWIWPYREHDPIGGRDPYSNSKGCSELVTFAFINSYFGESQTNTYVASARSGNVIGGGDWATDRLIPDIIRSFSQNQKVLIRYPNAIRPWQHVLEPLSGYLALAEKLYLDGQKYSSGWNFGPNDTDTKTVAEIVTQMCQIWGDDANWLQDIKEHPHEASLLCLDCSKAKMLLGWYPTWNSSTALDKLTLWYRLYFEQQNMLELTKMQIHEYMKDLECVNKYKGKF